MTRHKSEQFAVVAILLAILIAGFLRARSEATLWIDETYTLQVVQLSISQIVDIARADFHPPTYYLLLKAWLSLGSLIGLESSLLWARCLNLLFWVLAVATTAWFGRRLVGAPSSFILALAVASSASFASMTQDLRSYGPVAACFIMATIALLVYRESEGRNLSSVMLLATAASASVWLHNFSWIFVGLLFPVAAVLDWRLRSTRRPLASGALAVACLVGSPCLTRLLSQTSQLAGADTSWMMPANLANLLNSLWFWQVSSRLGSPWLKANALSAMSSLALLCLVGFLGIRSWKRSPPRSTALMLIGASLLLIVATWGLARFEIAPVFQGTRYQLLVGPVLVLCLAVLALNSERPTLGRMTIWVAVLTGFLGQATLFSREVALEPRTSSLVDQLESQTMNEPIFAIPRSLVAYHRSLSFELGHRIRPVGEICESGTGWLLTLSSWHNLYTGPERVALAMLARGDVRSLSETTAPPSLEYYSLQQVELAVGGERCKSTFSASRPEGNTGGWAYPANQVGRGWSYLEINDAGTPYQWTSGPSARLVFETTVGPGSYLLVVQGYALEGHQTELAIDVGDDALLEHLSGGFSIERRVQLKRPTAEMILRSRVREVNGRSLGVSLIRAELRPVPD